MYETSNQALHTDACTLRSDSQVSRLTFCQATQIALRFDYLSNWQVNLVANSNHAVSANLMCAVRGTATGRIQIEVNRIFNETNRMAALKAFVNKLKNAGLFISGAPVVPMPPRDGFTKASVFDGKATYKEFDFDCPAIIFEDDQYHILIGMIGISQFHSPEWWAFNKRAFEIVRDSIRVGEMVEQRQPNQTPVVDLGPLRKNYS